MKRFAAIDVGSYELTMKIFEISPKYGLREIDCIKHYLDLGTQVYIDGKLSHDKIEELCDVLKEFNGIMKSYKVGDYKAFGTSAIREARNRTVILAEIAQRTGITVDILSNSEQRFLDLKAIASKGDEFNKRLEKDVCVIDIGGGSIQISAYSKGSLMASSNLRLGVLRVQDALKRAKFKKSSRQRLIGELIEEDLATFKRFFLSDFDLKEVIVFDDYLSILANKSSKLTEKYEDLAEIVKDLSGNLPAVYAEKHSLNEEEVLLAEISAIIVKRFMEMTDATGIWIPGVTLSEGIVYDYAVSKKLIHENHDFEKDIITCAECIAQRYRTNDQRAKLFENTSLTLFDSLKKYHGLSNRDRLLMRIAAKLNDCGRFVTLLNAAEAAHSIIMATEILGLSHRERKMVADIVKYNHIYFTYDEELEKEYASDKEGYLAIVKMVAIFQLSNSLDRSRMQKPKSIKAKLDGNELNIIIKTGKDFSLEKGLFERRANLFKEVYSINPVIKVIEE